MFRAYAPIIRSDNFRQAAYGILSCLPLRGGVRSDGVRRVYTEGVTARLIFYNKYYMVASSWYFYFHCKASVIVAGP
jgi:hypothetical protein